MCPHDSNACLNALSDKPVAPREQIIIVVLELLLDISCHGEGFFEVADDQYSASEAKDR